MSSNPQAKSRRRSRVNRNQQSTQVGALVKASKLMNPKPPSFDASHHYVQRFRFVCTLPVTEYPINPSDFANLLAVVTGTASGVTTMQPIYTRFRIKSVEMWAIPTSLTAPVTVSISPQNTGDSAVNTERTVSDTSKSLTEYAYVKFKPKLTSALGQWQTQTSTGGALRFNCPGATIIDVVLHVYLCNAELPTPINIDSPNVVADGYLVMNALDPSSTGPSIIQPLSYANVYYDQIVPTPRP